MTQTIHFIRRNPVSVVAIFVLPLVAAFLFVSIQSAIAATIISQTQFNSTQIGIQSQHASQTFTAPLTTTLSSATVRIGEVAGYECASTNRTTVLNVLLWEIPNHSYGSQGTYVDQWFIQDPNDPEVASLIYNGSASPDAFPVGAAAEVRLPLNPPAALTAGTIYRFDMNMQCFDQTPQNYSYRLRIDYQASDVLTPGEMQTSTGGGSYNDVGSADLWIVLSDQPVPQGAPSTVSNMQQFESDGSTEIGEGQTTDESTVVFKADVSSSDGNQVRWQIELREAGEGFLNTYDPMDGGFLQTDPVDATTPTPVEITRLALTNGDYHWQYRAYVDATGESSPWTEYEAAGNTDFIVSTTQEIKVAVILAEPAGESFDPGHDKTYYETEIIPKVKEYWCEVSFGVWNGTTCTDGQAILDIQVFDNAGAYYQLPGSVEDYGSNDVPAIMFFKDGNGQAVHLHEHKDLTQLMVWDAVNAADDDNPMGAGEIANFSVFDIVSVVTAGHTQQSKSNSGGGIDTDLPKTQAWFRDYAPTESSNELVKNELVMSEFDGVGPWAHEIGHALGDIVETGSGPLCDVYPFASSGCGNVGSYGLMGFGSNNKDALGASVPAALSSFSKESLGWLSSSGFVGLGNHDLHLLDTLMLGGSTSRYATNDGYYLLESRSKIHSEWDVGISKSGLIVYRVDTSNSPDTISYKKGISAGEGPYRNLWQNIRIGADNISVSGGDQVIDVGISQLVSTNLLVAGISQDKNILNAVASRDVPLSAAGQNTDELPPSGGDVGRVAFGLYPFTPQVVADRSGELGVYTVAILILLLALLAKAYFVIQARGGALDGRQRTLELIVNYTLLAYAAGVVAIFLWRALVLYDGAQKHFIEGSSTESTTFVTGHALPVSAPDLNNPMALPDLDLHAYDDQGNHVGVNYVTGAYEIGISGAESSGDTQIGQEWISVPEGTNVHFEVSTNDIEQFFAENPDIEASLSSTEETYTFGVVTYDAASQRYESAPVENITINPGETRVHTIGGTTEAPTVDEGVVMVEFEPIADTYLRNGSKNKNYGDEITTWIRGSGKRSTLVQFDQQAIADAVGTGTLISATLEMATVDGSSGSWTSNGKLVGAYRLTHSWTELGATWNCGNDTDTSDSSPDCPGETWEMNQNQAFSWEVVASDSILFTNDSSGTVSWDVISDLAAWLSGSENYGWIIRKNPDGSSGRVQFHSRETAMPPELRIVYDVVN